MTCGQVLALYGEHHAPTLAAPERVGYAISALDPFWGDVVVSAANGPACRRYERERGVSPSTVRRELGVLQAAFNWCAKEGFLTAAPTLSLPGAAEPRDRWLTRQEMALLLWATRRLRVDGKHLAKFIIASRYTGTRKAAVLSIRLDGPSTAHGWIEGGVLHRIGRDQRRTKKRRPPVAMPRQLALFVSIWRRNGQKWLVEDYRGNRVGDIKNAWKHAVQIAVEIAAARGLSFDPGGVVPHVLRHTAITWAMQAAADPWQVSGFFGVSRETLDRVYAHHHPGFQESARKAMETGAKLGHNGKRGGASD